LPLIETSGVKILRVDPGRISIEYAVNTLLERVKVISEDIMERRELGEYPMISWEQDILMFTIIQGIIKCIWSQELNKVRLLFVSLKMHIFIGIGVGIGW